MNEKILAKIKNFFANKPEIVAVYLYGSIARGEEKKGSDLDLAVLFEDNVSDRLPLRFTYERELGHISGKKVEIQELNIVGVEFVKRVIDEGLLVLDKQPDKRITFQVNTLNCYFDMLPFYEEYYEVLRQQSAKGNFHA